MSNPREYIYTLVKAKNANEFFRYFEMGQSYESIELADSLLDEVLKKVDEGRLDKKGYDKLSRYDCIYLYSRLAFQGRGMEKNIDLAVRYFYALVQAGYSNANYIFGYCLYYGFGVMENEGKALEYLNIAAENHDARAQTFIGQLKLDSPSLKKEETPAIYQDYVLKAALKEYGPACYLLAKYYQQINNLSEAMPYFLKAAANGVYEAQTYVGKAYFFGQDGFPEDNDEALKWLTLAEKNHQVGAIYWLGFCYENGFGLDHDDWKKASLIYEKGLTQGDEAIGCATELGTMYYRGNTNEKNPFPQDYKKAFLYFQHDAKLFGLHAEYWLGVCYENGHGIDKDLRQAFAHFSSACEGTTVDKNPDMFTALGRGFYYGYNGEPNMEKACECFTQAAKYENHEANYYLAFICLEGKYLKKDPVKIVDYLASACSGDHLRRSDAAYALGSIYERGLLGIKIDYVKAEKYYWTGFGTSGPCSARLGYFYYSGLGSCGKSITLAMMKWNEGVKLFDDPECHYFLGLCYYYGEEGVKPNHKKASLHFQKAAQQGYKLAYFYVGEAYYKGWGINKDYRKAKEYLLKAKMNHDDHADQYLADAIMKADK